MAYPAAHSLRRLYRRQEGHPHRALAVALELAVAMALAMALKQQRYLRAVSWVGVQSVQSNELAGAP